MSKKHKGKHKPKPVKVTEIQAAPVVAGTKWPSSSKGYVPCHESHPVLKVGKRSEEHTSELQSHSST